MQPYMEYPIGFIKNLALWQMIALVAAAIALAAFAWGASRLAAVRKIEPWLPAAITVVVLVLAVYAYFFRTESGPGRVALHDAIALRSFAWYITPFGLAAAFAGYALAMKTTFRRDPVLLATVTDLRVVLLLQDQDRPRALLDGAPLPAGHPAGRDAARRIRRVSRVGQSRLAEIWRAQRAASRGSSPPPRSARIVVVMLGFQFWRASQPLLTHVEYAGLIPKVEALAKNFGDRDLVIVESRASGSELHVLALPLAYVYARNILVLNTPRPDPIQFREFLRWARTQYEQVFFLGGGGTDLLTALDRHRPRHERALPGARVGFTDERAAARARAGRRSTSRCIASSTARTSACPRGMPMWRWMWGRRMTSTSCASI